MIAIPLNALRTRARQMVAQELPEFMEAVEQAKAEKSEIDLSLKTFPGDSELLYLCLWLAYDEGVSVRMLPKRRPANK